MSQSSRNGSKDRKHPLQNGSNSPPIKAGVLCKKAVIKRKTFSGQNYKSRLFELTEKYLAYYDGDLQHKGKEKGSVDLKDIKVVMDIQDKELDDKNNVFQIVYQERKDYCIMYVQASSSDERRAWLEAIRTSAQKAGASFFDKYHPGVWTRRKPYFSCCDQSDRNAIGCKCDAFSERERERPVPPVPPPRTTNKTYVAMYDFTPTDEFGLELIQGEKYTIIDDTAQNWWLAENVDGQRGYIPSNYIKLNCGLEVFEWYYKELSREASKALLMESGKEGSFLVRDSVSSPGDYTLSIFTLEGGKENVRHYQIKRNEAGQYYISVNYPQNSIQELVHYHKHNAGGIYTRLREPPPRGDKPSTAGFGVRKWELDPHHLTKGRELGRGCFGVVYEGQYMNGMTKTPVAIKEMSVKPSSDEVMQEFKTMTQLHHPNLVQLYGVILNKSTQMIITELLSHGALNGYLQRHKKELYYAPSRLLEMGLHVCYGMEYLDNKKIIHRDLAARNCLVGNNYVVKVGDFGLARIVLEDDEYQMSEGTKFPFKWAPPEVLYHRKFSSKSDIWAYGILLWEIYSFGEMPYTGMKNPEVLKFVAEEGKRLKKPTIATAFLYDIMKRCWAEQPQDRPTFREIRVKMEPMMSRGDYITTDPGS